MMRADPDIIMVGEIRDRETAQIAVESALTGHLVLSTLHTNDAPTAITRLIEMGIEPFLVASAIDCVVAQRLARTLCSHCKRPHDPHARRARATTASRRSSDVEAYEPVGCSRCGEQRLQGPARPLRGHDGHRGDPRAGHRSAPRPTRSPASPSSEGMRRLRDDGLEKVRLGMTSIAEVARVTGSGA